MDVVAKGNSIYSVLCRQKGYTYNHYGQLLYFGGIGPRVGLTQTASAVAAAGDRAGLDSGLNRITVFDPTEYAVLIHAATEA